MEKPDFIAAVKEEYLNERSHYRETGIKQTRYKRVQNYNATSQSYHLFTRENLLKETLRMTLPWMLMANTDLRNQKAGMSRTLMALLRGQDSNMNSFLKAIFLVVIEENSCRLSEIQSLVFKTMKTLRL